MSTELFETITDVHRITSSTTTYESVFTDDSCTSSSEDESQYSSYDVLINGQYTIDKNLITYFPIKDDFSLEIDTKNYCKILKFSNNWKLDEILLEVSHLDPKVYPNLFVLIFTVGSFKSGKCSPKTSKLKIRINQKVKTLIKLLARFGDRRPLILQVTSKTQKSTRIYYKNKDSENFVRMKKQDEQSRNIVDFSSFLSAYLDEKIENFEELMLKKLPKVKNSDLILRFLRLLPMSTEFFNNLILKCTAYGTVDDLLAAMDATSFHITKNIEPEVQYCLTERMELAELRRNDQSNVLSDESMDDHQIVRSSEKKLNKMDDNFDQNKNHSSNSILLTAMTNQNQQIFNFLVTNFPHLLQELPIDCQSDVSNVAFRKNLDALCDLLDICDFPFPNNDTNLKLEERRNERFEYVIKERLELHKAITDEDYKRIGNYINKHPNLKIIHSPTNDSAVYQAVEAKKYKVLQHLKARGFKESKYEYGGLFKNDEEQEIANKYKAAQRRQNVSEALPNMSSTAMMLASRSFIHNKGISKSMQVEYQEKIRLWYQRIQKISDVSPVMDTAACCSDLKIIFDFESETTSSINLSDSESFGVTYPQAKWIFIGAKTLDGKGRNREGAIRGVIAHETCHYAMNLGYENQENPYLKNDQESEKLFTEIVNEMNKWVDEDSEGPDDECDGIISSAFKFYDEKDYNPELIARVPHILAQFDDDKVKIAHLEKKFKQLFDYHRNKVVPDLRNFNIKERQNVRKFNKTSGQLSVIRGSNYEFSALKELNQVISSQKVVVRSNTPSLLLLNILKNLSVRFDKLVDAKCIFTSAVNFKNAHILSELQGILQDTSEMNVIIDCTKELDADNLKKISNFSKVNFVFVALGKQNCEELKKAMTDIKIEDVNYTWNDLTSATKVKLLETKVNFKNKLIAIGDLYSHDDVQINDEILEKLIEKVEIRIGFESAKNVKHFNILFRMRKFKKIIKIIGKFDENHEKHGFDKTNKSQQIRTEEIEMTQEEIIEDVVSKKYVLISDLAGTGKSWALKNIAMILNDKYPTRWTELIDLKQFSREYKEMFDLFPNFIAEKVLKLKTSYEMEIFHKMYENGKICILFDGFDEIAPNFAPFVMELFKSFKSNGGNKLWIATRDYFEVNLQHELKLDEVYKLKEFTEDDGIELITSSLILHELEYKSELISGDEIHKMVKSHTKYVIYEQKGRDLSKMICGLNNKSIGFPQFYQMIADIYRNKNMDQIDLTIYQIFKEFVRIYYERWSSQKGEIRKEANTLSQFMDLNYMKLHEFFAMKGSYPQLDSFCDLILSMNDWSEEEIIACGLLVKENDHFQFQHETLREFFIAEFLLRILKKGTNDASEEFCGFLVDIMTIAKFGVVRMFINDALSHDQIKDKFIQIIPKIGSKIDKLDFLLNIFKNNLEVLKNMWVDYYKSLKYEELRTFLFNNNNSMLDIAEDEELCKKFLEFPYSFLNAHDLYELMSHNRRIYYGCTMNFISLIVRNNSFEILKDMIEYLLKIFSDKQVHHILRQQAKYELNLLLLAARYSEDGRTFEYLWKILKNSCKSIKKFLKVVREVDDQENNVLHLAVARPTGEVFGFIIQELEILTSREVIRKFIRSTGENCRNLLQASAVINKSLQFYVCIWETMRKYLDQNNMLEIITHTDEDEYNLLHCAVSGGKSEIIKTTWIEIQKTVHDSIEDESNKSAQLQKIVTSRVRKGMTLLQIDVIRSKDKATHGYIWKLMREFCKSDEEFLGAVKEVDDDGNNIFHLAVRTSKELFGFIIEKLENLTSKEDIKKLLKSVRMDKRNLLQLAAKYNPSTELYDYLMDIMRKYFDSNEVLEIIVHKFGNKKDTFGIAVDSNISEFIEKIWGSIDESINSANFTTTDTRAMASEFNDLILNGFDNQKINNSFMNKWESLASSIKLDIASDLSNKISKLEVPVENSEILHKISSNSSMEFQEKLWENLWKVHGNKEKLMKIIMEPSSNGNNYLHLLVMYNEFQVIEFTFNKCKKIFENSEYLKILKSKGKSGRSFLQIAAYESQSIRVFQLLWKILHDSCDNFLKFITEPDDYKHNTIHLIIQSSKLEHLQFIIKQLEAQETKSGEIKKILKTKGHCDENLLHNVSKRKSLELNMSLWKIIQKFFSESKILKMIYYCDADGDNILHDAVFWSTKEIVEFTWNQIKLYIKDEKDRMEYLKMVGHRRQNLLEMSMENRCNDSNVKICVETLVKEYKIDFSSSESLIKRITGFFR